MRTKLTNTVFTLLLLLSAISSFGQKPSFDFYDIMTLKGDAVKNVLQTYPQFAFLDFTYKKSDDGNYALEGYVKDKDSNTLGSIYLTPMTDHPPYRFKNLEMGHLYLDSKTMEDHNVDGSENYVLTPTKCKDPQNPNLYVDYVSYRFSNRAEKSIGYITDKEITSATAVKSFTLNPSPPYQ